MSLVTINENGRKIRVSKHDVAMKQLMNNAMQGKPSGLRMYLAIAQPASEKAALAEAAQSSALEDVDVDNLTDQQIMQFIMANRKDQPVRHEQIKELLGESPDES